MLTTNPHAPNASDICIQCGGRRDEIEAKQGYHGVCTQDFSFDHHWRPATEKDKTDHGNSVLPFMT